MNEQKKYYNSYHSNNGWRSRGYLPHFDKSGLDQFVTFRLFDSLPAHVMANMEASLKLLSADKLAESKFKHAQKIMDNCLGCCYLKDSKIAKIAQSTLHYYDNHLYNLQAYVIMPNHIHHLLCTIEPHSLWSVIKKIKSYSSTAANQALNRSGKFWAKEYYDRYIRNYQHYENTINYILHNPVTAGLVPKPTAWPYTWIKKH